MGSGCEMFWYHEHQKCLGEDDYKACTTQAYDQCKQDNANDFETCCHCSGSEELLQAKPAATPAAPTCSNDNLAWGKHSGCEMFWYHEHQKCLGEDDYKACTTQAYDQCKQDNENDFETCCHCSGSEELLQAKPAATPAAPTCSNDNLAWGKHSGS